MKSKGLFVTGTDTGVGKTQVAFGFAAALQRKLAAASCDSASLPVNGEKNSAGSVRNVQLWKPVQTGVAAGQPDADSYILHRGSGLAQAEQDMVTVTLPDPLAPWMAARRNGRELDFNALVLEGRRRFERGDFLVIEGAGGITVPFTASAVMADLALQLELPLLIVARAGLGTVNHSLLTVSYARSKGLKVAGVILNGYRDAADPSLRENAMMIEHFGKVPVIGMLPWFELGSPAEPGWNERRERWIDMVCQELQWDLLMGD